MLMEYCGGKIWSLSGWPIRWICFFCMCRAPGKLSSEDETLLTVSFAQTNGRPFRSVTRFMLDQGKIKSGEASYRNVKSILKEKARAGAL